MENIKPSYFILPRKIFKMNLSIYEMAIYIYIIYCTDWKSRTARVKISTIASNLSLGQKTVSKYLHILNDKKLIRLEPTYYTAPDGKYRKGTYIIHIMEHTFT